MLEDKVMHIQSKKVASLMRISPYLEDSSIDVDEGNRGQGNVEEFLLPAIRVNLRRKMKGLQLLNLSIPP